MNEMVRLEFELAYKDSAVQYFNHYTTTWFLFQHESVSKPCMTNPHLRYNNLFSSRCSKGWSPFSQGGLNLEEFIIDVHVPSLLPFFVKEFTEKSVYGMEIALGLRSKADLAAESALSQFK